MNASKIILGIFILTTIIFFIPSTAFCQTEKLGIISYTPPKGMTKTLKENVVGFSEMNQSTGSFCIITLYGATVSSGTPNTDFTNSWNNLAVKNLNAKANPETETQSADGWTIIAGASAVDSEGVKGAAFLTVISGFGKTVSVLAVFNDKSYMDKIAAFVAGLDLDKTAAPTNNKTIPNKPTYDANGHLIIPPPSRQLTVADFAGEWGQNDGITTNYVDRYTGDHVGTDSYHFTNKMTLTAEGGYLNDFFGIKNGKKIMQDTTGSFAVTGRVLTIAVNGGNTDHYLIRGWLELPDMTIFEISGSLEVSQIQEHLANPDKGWNLNSKWVRKK
jgi:hypothetical protein